jgi:regulator of sirC expression with transglutaminase-like and TPR domain
MSPSCRFHAGHFLLKLSAGGEEVFLDPFNRGAVSRPEGPRRLFDDLYQGRAAVQ